MSQQQDDENLPNHLTNVLLREDSRAGLPPQRQSAPVAAPAPSPQATQQATAGAAVAARWQNKNESAAQTGEIFDRSSIYYKVLAHLHSFCQQVNIDCASKYSPAHEDGSCERLFRSVPYQLLLLLPEATLQPARRSSATSHSSRREEEEIVNIISSCSRIEGCKGFATMGLRKKSACDFDLFSVACVS